jgi:fimbrial isopeptide formation D2 family protein/LPXTG-motif cell wall-anchored protein
MRKPAQEGRRRSTFARLVFSILAAIAMLATGGIVAAVHAPVAQAATGPDGASAPYVYWNVTDTAGNPVSGATFTLQTYQSNGFWGGRWGGDRSVSDCTAAGCTGVDRDTDGSEFLAKWINSNTPGQNPGNATPQIQANGHYRIRPVDPPAGYQWANGTDWVDSNSKSWASSGGSSTLNFGTFQVVKLSTDTAPKCDPGYVYGVRRNGQIVYVDPNNNNTVKTLGGPANVSKGMNFNGLGIGTGGSPVYAYNRSGDGTDSRPMIYQFNTSDGTWKSTNTQVPQANSSGVTFIAGAVSLDNGHYFLGGYAGSGRSLVFKLWEYTPGNPGNITYKGYVATPANDNGENNGDIAFDSNGNLFIVRGSGGTTTIYSVTASDLAAANGNTSNPITASPSNSVSGTSNDVNGVAFDYNGNGYLGSFNVLDSYDMPNWTNETNITTNLGSSVQNNITNSTDLASCSSPPTISVQKDVQVGRAHPGDQFKLTLNQQGSGIEIANNTTTTGSPTGVQPGQIGPLPTKRNAALTFAESAAGTTTMSDYNSTWSCLVDGDQLQDANGNDVAGTGTSGSVTIPTDGQDVTCIFTNTPKPMTATVNVHKLIKYSADATPQPIAGWTVGATSTGSTGTVTQNPAGTTQQTNADGVASWGLTFGNANGVANVAVNEQQQGGYQFDSGNALNQCKVTGSGASSQPITISSQGGVNVPNVKPGQTVYCTFVNVYKNVPTKQVADPTDGVKLGSTVPWTIVAPVQPDKPGAITKFVVTDKLDSRLAYSSLSVQGFTQGADYTVDPATGANGNTVTVTFTPTGLGKLAAGQQVTMTLNTKVNDLGDGVIPNQATVFTNGNAGIATSRPDKPGTNPTTNWGPLEVCKQPAGDGSEPQDAGCDRGLAGAEFTVYSDSDATNVAGTLVTGDDGIGRIALFVGNNDDKGPKTYYLKETKAPAGYVRDSTVRTVQIKAGAESTGVIYYVPNVQQTPPTLPLTGGMSTDAFLIGGSSLIVVSAGVWLALRRRSRAEA